MGLGDWLSNAWDDFKDFGADTITSIKEGTNWFIDNTGSAAKDFASGTSDVLSGLYSDAKVGGSRLLESYNKTLELPKSIVGNILSSPTAWLLAAGVGLVVINKVL